MADYDINDQDSIPVMDRDFSVRYQYWTVSECQPMSYVIGTSSFFTAGKATGVCYPLSSSSDSKSKENCSATLCLWA